MKNSIFSFLLILMVMPLFSQSDRAALQLDATDKGILIPRLTQIQKDSLATKLGAIHQGLMIFNVEANQFCFWDSISWQTMGPNYWDTKDGVLSNTFGSNIALGVDSVYFLDYFTVSGTSYFWGDISHGLKRLTNLKEIENYLGVDSIDHSAVLTLDQHEQRSSGLIIIDQAVIDFRARADTDPTILARDSDDHNPSLIVRNKDRKIGHEIAFKEEHSVLKMLDYNEVTRIALTSRDTSNFWPVISLHESEGQATVEIIGEEDGAGALKLKNGSGQDRITMNAVNSVTTDPYINLIDANNLLSSHWSSSNGLEMFNTLGQKTFTLNRDAEMSFYAPTNIETIEIRPYDIEMRSSKDKVTVSISGEGGDDAGHIILADSTGFNAKITLDANYGDGDSRIITDELELKGGSDFAEHFDITSTNVVPGMLMSIDPNNPGKLEISKTAYDKKVAGVISGANGIKPGIYMGQKGTIADGTTPIALSGRVYVLADADYGSIHPGDLLTTSVNPGHAMRAQQPEIAHGATIGKAMTELLNGTGYVLILVSLQ